VNTRPTGSISPDVPGTDDSEQQALAGAMA
jgi:hypothetical protein